MTPRGIFPSRRAVAEAYSTYPDKIRHWMKKFPTQFYYVSKGEEA
jgi:hypothetical protein